MFPIQQWDFQSESILSGLPAADWELVSSRMTESSYVKGNTLFREGSYPTGIFYILKGMVKKYRVDKEGHEQIIYVASRGELVGYHAVLAEDRFPDSCSVLEDSIIAFIPKEDFVNAVEQSPVLSKRLLKTLSHEFAVLANNITLFSHGSVRERLALQLVVMREKYKDNALHGKPVEIRMSREDLANLVGSARENVVRVLSEFRDAGIISSNGRRIVIQDVEALIRIANYR